MRWRGRRESENIEDRRGESPGFRFPFPRGRGGQGRIRFPSGRGARRGGGLGLTGIIILLIMIFVFKIDPRILLQNIDGGSGTQVRLPGSQKPITSKESDELKKFVSVVLATTEDVWKTNFQSMGQRYREPRLVLFTGAVQSACGTGQSAMGPFYCPLDQKVYIDLSFYKELKNRFRAPGDFAQAYVVAHEIGHHVQTLLGISAKVQAAKRRASSKTEANAIQVKMELQADCFAGLWAHQADKAKNILEDGDIDEALRAASAIGDDNIQRQTRGIVVPDSFTHGSSEQRVRWFKRGFNNGTMAACDTFNASRL